MTSFTETEEAALPLNFGACPRQGAKQKPGRLTRSIRGWTVPTLEPEEKE